MKDKLTAAREVINEADKEIAKLFEKRMHAVEMVAQHKKECGLPVYDGPREDAIIKRNLEFIEEERIRPYYQQFLKNVMAVSRSYQHRLLEGLKVAYSGVEGAFAYIAASNIFPDAKLIAYSSFKGAYKSVVEGECDLAVLPIENSFAGEVGQVLDLMFAGSLYINGIYDLPIVHNLLLTKGAKLSDVKTVISHPQALSQCAPYIEQHNYQTIEAYNTAGAAKEVAKRGDPSIAAIASKETAQLYGLEIGDHDINESATNTTRFAVFSSQSNTPKATKNNNFILMFTVSNTAGSLAKAISIIGRNGFNMRVLRSRPMKELAWMYYFYVEAEGDIANCQGQKLIAELKESCDKLKVVGTYSSIGSLDDLKEVEL